jgi:uncharacterized cupredoxin-like copper-binding protein
LTKLTKAMTVFALLAVAVAIAAGCGDGDDDSGSAPTQTTDTTTTETTPASGGKGSNLQISADPSGALEFDKKTLTANAGRVTIKMDNPSSVDHAVSIKGNGVDAEGNVVGAGGVSTVSAADLKPGKYEFYCPVDGHEQAGMRGELTVK